MSTNQSSEYPSVREVAAHPGKSYNTIRTWIKNGSISIRPRKKNERIQIERSSLMVFWMTEGVPTIEGTG